MEQPKTGPNLDHLFEALAKSPFRRRFKLLPLERSYLVEKGLPTVLAHACDFIAKRLAPAIPANDGKQTPVPGPPGLYRPACDRHLLLLLPCQMAQDSEGKRAHGRATELHP
jgi:hypothetical protein